MKPLEDTDPMPFGKHKGRPMKDVPAYYLHWFWSENQIGSAHRRAEYADSPVMDYIKRKLSALKKEYPNGIWS
jgi:hypothetical protein